MSHGYSDRIAHAFAVAAKHGTRRPRESGTGSWPTAPANVAVILARHGAEETAIVAGVLRPVVNDAEAPRRQILLEKVREKFGERVAELVGQVLEPRFDSRGKQRSWEVARMEFLSSLAGAETTALDVLAAHEIYACGALLTDVRRLGPEYLSTYAPGGGPAVRRWFDGVVDILTRHPTGPRPALLGELRQLAGKLGGLLD